MQDFRGRAMRLVFHEAEVKLLQRLLLGRDFMDGDASADE
jgi:hypothetical protein